MKQIFVVIVFGFLLGFGTSTAFAETSVNIENNGDGATSDVHVENSMGQSTTCVNGNCSTTKANNSTTVCINGKCETSQDGNVDRKEGGATVKIENHAVPSMTVLPPPKLSPTHSMNSGQAASDSGKASISAKKADGQEKQFTLEQMFAELRNFLTNFFSQNK